MENPAATKTPTVWPVVKAMDETSASREHNYRFWCRLKLKPVGDMANRHQVKSSANPNARGTIADCNAGEIRALYAQTVYKKRRTPGKK